jgi:aminomethyltransferase
MSNAPLLRSPLYDLHVAAGAAMTAEAGWEVPARYGDARAEAGQARQGAAVADVTPAGRVRIRGDGAGRAVEKLCGAESLRQEDDTVRPVTLRDASGGVLGAARLLRLEDFWLVLTSPAGRQAAVAAAAEIGSATDASVDDQTEKTAMIACLGPRSAELLDSVLPVRVSDLPDGGARTGSLLIAKYIVLRSDLRGAAPGAPQSPPLWRMEVILPAMLAGKAWRFITEKAGDNRIAPCGSEAMAMLQGEAV